MTYSDEETEKKLAELEEKIKEEYGNAYKELDKKSRIYFEKLQDRYKEEYAAYQNGKYTKEQFENWYAAQIARGERWEALKEDFAKRITNANEVAAAYVNDTTPSIYSLNHNYEAYQIAQSANVDFNLYNEQTVKELMQGFNHSEFRTLSVNPIRDYEWNSNQIQSALISGILQGKTPKDMTDAFMGVMKRNRNAAIRNARTAVTSAQNGGKQRTYEEAERKGIILQKEWMATHDERTRDSHAALDGVRVNTNERFPNGCRYPADPEGAPAEVYNCRCTTRAILPKFNIDQSRVTYNEWLENERLKEESENE